MKAFKRMVPILTAIMLLSILLPISAKGSPDTWTFMVYLDADNDLEEWGIINFMQMSEVGSSANVNILVQFDRVPGYDESYGGWTGCRRFDMSKGMTPADGPTQNLGEINMGDPASLVDFVSWADATHPADHYVLIIWDHGGDWVGACWDETSSYDYLDISEIHSALSSICTNLGKPLDIVSFDACSMGSIEVGYQLRQYADYFVASEVYVPDLGFSYDRPLWALHNDSTMTPLAFCSQIVNGYHDLYASMIGKPYQYMFNQSLTLSVIDTDKIGAAVRAADNLSSELYDNMTYWVNHVRLAYNNTDSYEGTYYYDIVDLYRFADELRYYVANDTIDSLCNDLMTAINACVLVEMRYNDPFHFSQPVDNTHGMSVYFPKNMTEYDGTYGAPLVNFSADTHWNEFLMKYYVEVMKGNPTIISASPSGMNASLNGGISIAFSEPMDVNNVTNAFSIYPAVAGAFQWIPASNTLSFTPSDHLALSTCYVVIVNSTASDAAGHHMKYNYSWNFTTRGILPGFTTVLNLTGELGENGWYISQVNATLSTTDPEGTNWTRYQLNASGWQTYSSMMVISIEGNYTLEYCSQDLAGTTYAAENATIGIDLNVPSSLAAVSGSRVTIAASDNISGVNRTMYRIDGGVWQEYTWAFDVTGSGNHTVEYYSVDEAGHIEQTKTAWVDNGMNAFEIIASYGLYIAVGIVLIIVVIAVFNYASKGKGRDRAD
jgi:hypothetical protein